jgi:predicted branched-subunit amino acid permease
VVETFGLDVVFPAFFVVLLDELRESAPARAVAALGRHSPAAWSPCCPPGSP